MGRLEGHSNEDFLCIGWLKPSLSLKHFLETLQNELTSLHLPRCLFVGLRKAETVFPDLPGMMLTGKPGQSEGSHDYC